MGKALTSSWERKASHTSTLLATSTMIASLNCSTVTPLLPSTGTISACIPRRFRAVSLSKEKRVRVSTTSPEGSADCIQFTISCFETDAFLSTDLFDAIKSRILTITSSPLSLLCRPQTANLWMASLTALANFLPLAHFAAEKRARAISPATEIQFKKNDSSLTRATTCSATRYLWAHPPRCFGANVPNCLSNFLTPTALLDRATCLIWADLSTWRLALVLIGSYNIAVSPTEVMSTCISYLNSFLPATLLKADWILRITTGSWCLCTSTFSPKRIPRDFSTWSPFNLSTLFTMRVSESRSQHVL